MTSKVKYFNSLIHTGLSTFSSDTAGSLIAQLKAVFIDGFNPCTVASIVRVGSVVTVNTTGAHGYLGAYKDVVGQVVLIAGCTETDYNGEWSIETVPSTTSFTFNITTTPSTPATGSPTCKIAPLGWTREFNATNKEVWRSPNVTSPRHYFRLEEATTISVGATAFGVIQAPVTGFKYVDVSCYDVMTDADTGNQKLAQTYIPKAQSSVSSTTQPWMVVGDDTWAWIYTPSTTYAVGTQTYWTQSGIGALEQPFLANDQWCSMCYGCLGSNAANNLIATNTAGAPMLTMLGTAAGPGCGQMAKTANGFWSQAITYQTGLMTNTPSNGYANTASICYGIQHPNGPDLSGYAWPVLAYQYDPSNVIRGPLPGLYNTGFLGPSFRGYDAVPGFNIQAVGGARTMMLIRAIGINSFTQSGWAIDVTGPWR